MVGLAALTAGAALALAAPVHGGAVPRTLPLGVHRLALPPRSRALEARGPGHSIPADGSVFPTAIYWATVQIGSPPQDFAVGLDSGSGDLFVEGKDCQGCTAAAPNKQYDPSASSTGSRAFPYVFSHSYQTCSMKDPSATCTLHGNLYTDQVSVAGLGPVQIKFGAISGQTTNFDTKKVVGGLMGLAGEKGKDVFATLVAAGQCDNVWGLCLRQGSVSNGTLTLGGADERLADGGITYVPDSGFAFHGVTVESLAFAGKHVSLKQTAILDTGTNILVLPKDVLAELQAALCGDAGLAHCAALFATQCFELSDAQVDAYPSLSFQLDGLTLEMSSRDYLLLGSPAAAAQGQYCLGIRAGGDFIIGDTLMRNYYLVFDFAKTRIGFGKVNHRTCGSISADGVHQLATVVV